MSPIARTVVGLAAALAAGAVAHGPLGGGARLVDRLEGEAKAAVARAELPGIEVRLARRPLARAAMLTGPANDIQREGLGGQWGVLDHVRAVPGIGTVRWADEPPGRVVPLLAEMLGVVALAYFVGLGLGALLARRRRRRGYLD